jgi:hypothetical protein
MKINLETQFNIGDIVYAADHYYDFYATSKPYVISDIIINIDHRDVRTMYCVEQGDITDRFPEDWLFATYEECKRWCDKQNKEG